LLEHYFRPAEVLCLSITSGPQGCLGRARRFLGCPSPPGFPVRASTISIFVRIAPDYAELPSKASWAGFLFPSPLLEQAGNSRVGIDKPRAGLFSEDQGEHPLKHVAVADRN